MTGTHAARRIALALLVACTAPAAPSHAAEETLGTLTLPKAVLRRNPAYPVDAAARSKEGWVITSFCIDAEGKAHTPVIERSSGVPEFERASLKVIPSWRYEPARRDGVAIETCSWNVRLTFGIEGLPLGARRAFAKQWEKASRLVDEGKLAEAKAIVDSLQAQNNYESARIALIRASIAANTGDTRKQLDDLRAALWEPQSLEPALRREVRRRVFALELSQRDWAAAYDTYEDLATKVDEVSEAEKKAGEQLAALVAGDRPLATDAELACRCDKANGEPIWSARLLRREFSFTDATGTIDRFELRCTGTRFSAKFDTESAWTVPASWGDCTLYVFGEEGAKFRLVELAPQVAASAAPATPAP